MRDLLPELELAACATRVPTEGERTRVAFGGHGPPARGEDLDVPAFAVDPRLSPDVPHHLRRRIDRFTALGYMAVADALSGVPIAQQPDRDRIGVFIANTRSGWSYAEPELIRLIRSGVDSMRAYLATAWFPAALQGETTIGFNLQGCAKTTAGRTSGFGEALWLARDALEPPCRGPGHRGRCRVPRQPVRPARLAA